MSTGQSIIGGLRMGPEHETLDICPALTSKQLTHCIGRGTKLLYYKGVAQWGGTSIQLPTQCRRNSTFCALNNNVKLCDILCVMAQKVNSSRFKSICVSSPLDNTEWRHLAHLRTLSATCERVKEPFKTNLKLSSHLWTLRSSIERRYSYSSIF